MEAPSPPVIAVIEDDHHLRRDLVQFLQFRGLAAMGFHTAEEFETHQARWELVVLDIGLPGKSGLTLLADIKRQAAAPPVA